MVRYCIVLVSLAHQVMYDQCYPSFISATPQTRVDHRLLTSHPGQSDRLVVFSHLRGGFGNVKEYDFTDRAIDLKRLI